MIERVNQITNDPLSAVHEEEERLLIEALRHGFGDDEDFISDLDSDVEEKAKEKCEEKHLMETDILEQTLYKLGALMAIGYGEAGSRMIGENMSKGDYINPLLPGNKIIAIFGFCDIRKFTNATEILCQAVMIFVNEIGHICHGIVDRYSGAANKNIGDAFLFVWKLEEEDLYHDDNGKM